jgi:hypothetical protein
MTGNVYVMPTFVFTIDHIGGPNVGLKSFVEPVVEIDSASACKGGAQYTVNWGLQLTLGAHIKISFDKATILAPAPLTLHMAPHHAEEVLTSRKRALATAGHASSSPALTVPLHNADGISGSAVVTFSPEGGGIFDQTWGPTPSVHWKFPVRRRSLATSPARACGVCLLSYSPRRPPCPPRRSHRGVS